MALLARTLRHAATIAFLFTLVSILLNGHLASAEENSSDVPSPPREFRAAWIATVANIDWPSTSGLTTGQQQEEMIALLDQAAALHLNAVVFQVRPHTDALYDSKLEPWSEYLTGQMGKAPEPFYDPLKFAVREAHRRGLELHAWFNPYRSSHPAGKSRLSVDHISNTMPDVVHRYGKYWWLDPGEPAAVEHSLAVILDVVKRYDIDGVHFDDYFYPYPINGEDGKRKPFPDERSWQRAQAAGESLSRDDWRRQNVDQFIERVSNEIHREKPWVRFGISPFGIWKPGHPKSIKGFDAYARLYADSRKWLREGTVDYFTPQLYWKIDSKGQSYPDLLGWWQKQNLKKRHLWPGNFVSRTFMQGDRHWAAEEILEQIEVTRAQLRASGNVLFSMKALMPGRSDLAERLKAGPYAQPALVPCTDWLKCPLPSKPKLSVRCESHLLNAHLKPTGSKNPWLWVVRTQAGEDWKISILPGEQTEYSETYSSVSQKPTRIAVSAINRIGSEGPLAIYDLTGSQ